MYDSKVSSGTLVSSYGFYSGLENVGTDGCAVWNKIKDMVEREGLLLRKEGTNMDASPGYSPRRGVYDWLTEKEYTNVSSRNEDDKYGGMTPPVRTEY